MHSARLNLAKITMSYHHIYNRGAHKAPIFYEKSDYLRMLKLLYIANSTEPFQLREFSEKNIFEIPRADTLVSIVAYCLMPNHIHIAIKPKTDLIIDPGITKFMRKVCTGYSMYFNVKYDHSGTIWQGVYKKKIADDELDYLRILINYIHLNPYGIKEPEMTKEARKEHSQQAYEYSKNYEFSSFKDYLGEKRVQNSILDSTLRCNLSTEVAPQ
jgi:REP element-mobilizing transposase RayT